MADAHQKRVSFLRMLLSGGLLLGVLAHGGGFKIQDQSTRAMGMLDAFVAGADDASAVYYNPAGLTRLGGPEAIGNLYIAHATTYYSGPQEEVTSDGRVYTVPSFYLADPQVGDSRVALGIGAYAPFGLGSRWGNDFPANQNWQRTTLGEIRLVNVNPTVAYRFTDRLSLGFGVDYFISRVKNRYIQVYPDQSEGKVVMDADGDSWGYNLGLQWDVSETVRLGLTYRSQVSVDYDGDVDMRRLPTPMGPMNLDFPVSTTIDYPALVAAGVMWQATPRLRLEFTAEWADWSTRDVQTLAFEPPPGSGLPASAPTALDWEDSWIFMLGGEYRLTDKWTLRAGYAYNEMPAPAHTADATIPTDDMHVVSCGFGYRFNERWTIDVAAVLGYGMERTLKNPNVPYDSTYDSISTFVATGVTHRF